MMKISFLTLLLTITTFAAEPVFKLTPGFTHILSCPAAEGVPNVIIAERADKYYMAYETESGVKYSKLYVEDADMGYLGYEISNRQEAPTWTNIFRSIYIYNNEEDIDEGETALITWGQILNMESAFEIECYTVNEVAAY